MATSPETPEQFEFHPVTIDRWDDLAAFFAQHGNPNYCWCMRWRLKSAAFAKARAAERRSGLEAMVRNGVPVGILAYDQDGPVGWCSIARRETYTLLENSTILKRIDDQPTWSVVCFFVAPAMRGCGLGARLLQAGVAYAFANGAKVVEGYPVEPGKSYQFMGSPAIFAEAGFTEAAVAKNGRRIVRMTNEEKKNRR